MIIRTWVRIRRSCMLRNLYKSIIGTHVCAGNPLPVEFAPHGLAPAGVGECQVEAVFMKVVPIGAGDDVSEWVGEAVGNHLGLAGGA